MLESLWLYLTNNKLEVIAFIISVAGVWLTAKEKVINWPVGIIASALYLYIFYANSLFGDTALQVFYIVIGFYGWYQWLYGGKREEALQITHSSKKTLYILLIISIVGWIVMGKLLSRTSTNVPYWDGINTVLSLIATWMMAKKLIENWILWIITDISYVALYLYKDLGLTSLLYFIFTVLAVYGYYQWKKQLKKTLFA